ncbi:ATP synthase subunit f, mitochondrial-like [Prionailurus viverrinus]|uniref:ATP synthase subunit f, mitochondrial-like n=1 Tax=Prionailurus bengalensis TaxID=37029 RepID=UPI001CA85F72|nr:ATP synthase subunit f, mitochondrial-like [Prionailurus bengalensis]XP_047730665.1 ATP synthase subunit f, mitochondrial-like [Prionailurus viverrinus]
MMVSVIPVKEKLMDVKLGELPSWILLGDFFLRHGWNVSKEGIPGISMVLTAYVLFNYFLSYKELKPKWLHKYH